MPDWINTVETQKRLEKRDEKNVNKPKDRYKLSRTTMLRRYLPAQNDRCKDIKNTYKGSKKQQSLV